MSKELDLDDVAATSQKAKAELESLRQKLEEKVLLNNQLVDFFGLAEQQLADHIKREVNLRLALDDKQWEKDGDVHAHNKRVQEALAATADLDGLILCHADPVGYADPLDIAKDGNNDTFIVRHASEWHELLRFKTPLYRAWEPK